MAISATLLTSGSDVDLNASATTASITPTANRLVLAAVGSNNFSDDRTPTLTSSNLTWVQVAHIIVNGATSNRLTILRALTSVAAASAVTIQFANNQNAIVWSIVEIAEIKSAGVDGGSAVVQTSTSISTGGTAALTTLGAFADATNNGIYVACVTGNTTLSIEAGYAALHNLIDANTGTRLATSFLASSDTTAAMSLGAALPWGIFGIELAFSAAASTTLFSKCLLHVGL